MVFIVLLVLLVISLLLCLPHLCSVNSIDHFQLNHVVSQIFYSVFSACINMYTQHRKLSIGLRCELANHSS